MKIEEKKTERGEKAHDIVLFVWFKDEKCCCCNFISQNVPNFFLLRKKTKTFLLLYVQLPGYTKVFVEMSVLGTENCRNITKQSYERIIDFKLVVSRLFSLLDFLGAVLTIIVNVWLSLRCHRHFALLFFEHRTCYSLLHNIFNLSFVWGPYICVCVCVVQFGRFGLCLCTMYHAIFLLSTNHRGQNYWLSE